MSTGRLVLPALSSANRRRGRADAVAAGSLPAVEPVLPARRKGAEIFSTPSEIFHLREDGTLCPGGRMPPFTAGNPPSQAFGATRDACRYSGGFTLIEIMVVILLLAVIVLGLLAMFDQTQRAFRAGLAQTDVFEGGRAFNDQISRELEQVTPSYQNSGLNFYAQIPNYIPLPEALPGDTIPRINIFQDLFFVTKVNQTWNGIGYYVRTNVGYLGNVDPVGTLYRFETNIPVSPFNAGGASNAFQSFTTSTNLANLSKILDGVVEFRVHCFDTNGVLLTGTNVFAISNNFVNISNVPANPTWPPNEMSFYAFSNNIVPASVEIEVGILEPAVLKRYQSIPVTASASRFNFLSNHAGNIELFRQRIAIRNVDPSAYTTNYSPAPF